MGHTGSANNPLRRRRLTCFFCVAVTFAMLQAPARSEQVKVRHAQGAAHGFVEVVTLDGTRVAVGDLLQRAHGSEISSRLVLRFLDGSLDDETTVYSQRGVFQLINDHHIQRGPSFPNPTDVTIDARHGVIRSSDEAGHVKEVRFDMPPDTYNGLASTLLMNLSPAAPETRVALIVAGDKPRIVHLSMKSQGEAAFTMGGEARKAIDFDVHVELGGVAGVVAPVIGKQPPDFHVLIATGPDPAFIREEGPLYQGGPIWRIQQISAVFPKTADEHKSADAR
jgi:hypothetical protein